MSQSTSKEGGAAGDAAQGYAEALAELETILAELERTDVDVDVLATLLDVDHGSWAPTNDPRGSPHPARRTARCVRRLSHGVALSTHV